MAEVYMMDSTLLRIVVGFATVATAKRIVQALDTSITYLVGRFEGSRDGQRSGIRPCTPEVEREGRAAEPPSADAVAEGGDGHGTQACGHPER